MPQFRSFAAIVVVAVAITGCSRHSSESTGKKIAVLRYALVQEPTSMDPARSHDVPTKELLQNIYGGLVGLDENSRPFPNLASGWDVSGDGRIYTFHIRPNVRFHSPFLRPVTAEDVKYSLERALNPATKSPTAANYLIGIQGAADVAAGRSKSLAGVKVIDSHTVAVTLVKPMGYFLDTFAYPTAWIVCREAIEKNGGILDERAAIGTGPFMLAEYRHGDRVRLDVNPDYFLGKPSLSRIERPIVLDPHARHMMYENGELDALLPSLTDFIQDQKDPKLRSESRLVKQASITYLAFQERLQPAFKDLRIRQAIARAIDRDEIARIAFNGIVPSAYSFIPAGLVGEDSRLRCNSYDTLSARKLLDSAGYPGGRGFPPITLDFLQNSPAASATAQIIRDQLQRNLGISIALQEHEGATFWTDVADRERYAMFQAGWTADYPDPQNFLSTLLRTGAKLNHLAYSNAEFDKLCNIADAEIDPTKRAALYQKADKIAMSDAAIVPLVGAIQPMLIKPYVHGSQSNLMVFFLPHSSTRVEK